MKAIVILCAALVSGHAVGQTVYRCPPATAGAPPVIQQMPCTPTGGGETLAVKPIKSTGATLELSEQGRKLSEENNKRWTAQAEAEEKERQRQEALRVEREKALAAQNQAAAQWATANAIWAARGH